jgi:hypothetical protein
MLTYSQTLLVAARNGGGEVLCLDCFKRWLSDETDVPEEDINLGAMRVWLSTGGARDDGWYGIIEYVMGSEYNNDGLGVYCDRCGAQLAEPYCTECGENKEGLLDWANDGRNLCPACGLKLGYLVVEQDVADLLAPEDDGCSQADGEEDNCLLCPKNTECVKFSTAQAYIDRLMGG